MLMVPTLRIGLRVTIAAAVMAELLLLYILGANPAWPDLNDPQLAPGERLADVGLRAVCILGFVALIYWLLGRDGSLTLRSTGVDIHGFFKSEFLPYSSIVDVIVHESGRQGLIIVCRADERDVFDAHVAFPQGQLVWTRRDRAFAHAVAARIRELAQLDDRS